MPSINSLRRMLRICVHEEYNFCKTYSERFSQFARLASKRYSDFAALHQTHKATSPFISI